MASRKKRRQRRQTNTRISQHQQKGKRLTPPLAAMPNLQMHNWLEDTLPELLWPLSLISHSDHDGMLAFCAAMDAVTESVVGRGHASATGIFVDGSLSSLEAMPVKVQDAILDVLQRNGVYERAVPEGFAHALGMYPTAPGTWIIKGWIDQGLRIDPEAARQFLAPVISDSSHGQARVPTRAKALILRAWLYAGRLVPSNSDCIEMLPRYPNEITKEERRRLEPWIRATFGAVWTMADRGGDGLVTRDNAWPARFWRSNWHLYPCESAEHVGRAGGNSEDIRDVVETLTATIESAHDRFLARATSADPNIYCPDRYEVLTGLVSRSIRLVYAVATTPWAWGAEHGAPALRSVLESLIVFRYLIGAEDPELYERFKAFGQGHLKLQKLHLEEYLDSIDEPPEEVEELRGYLDALVNQDLWEEWQEIDLGGTFSGKDMRKMARAVGMETEYKLLLAPASSVAHGEWGALDRYALTRCLNPLHRWHRIPRAQLAAMAEPPLVQTVIGLVEDLVTEYESAIAASGFEGTDDE